MTDLLTPRLLLGLLLGMRISGDAIAAQAPVRSLPSIDLNRYAGTWHEVARFPNRFQQECAHSTVARYRVLPHDELEVTNSCVTADGKAKSATGKGKLAGRNRPNSQLKVRFAPAILSWIGAVWGDYWILDITDDYSVALVGSPDRKYLWILSRSETADPASYDRMIASGAAQGFDMAKLVRSGQ